MLELLQNEPSSMKCGTELFRCIAHDYAPDYRNTCVPLIGSTARALEAVSRFRRIPAWCLHARQFSGIAVGKLELSRFAAHVSAL